MLKTAPLPMAADLYGDIEPTPRRTWRDHLPGLAVAAIATCAAGFLADRYGAPLTLMALLVGLAMNFLSADPRLTPGLAFASRELLRWGIVLAGLRVTVAQIWSLGPVALVAVVAIVGLVLGAGVLAGGAVAICGASAALALATTLGERRVGQAQLTLVLVTISAMSAAAMVLYPLLAHALALTNLQAGFLLGASIHDVAQALGAGYSFSAPAGDIAAIVKLTRVALLAPVLALVALALPRDGGGRAGVGVPWFVVGFFVLAGITSAVAIPPALAGVLQTAATWLLAAAVAATAMRSPLAQIMTAGPRPVLVVGAATLAALALSLATALLLIH
jgi:uncharacterized integral membrane protein (TIGR00698 family)